MNESALINSTLSHYRIISKLGEGGMGEVYLAEDTQLGRKVAIKFLLSESTTDERAKKRLLREARAAAKLDHPNICTIHEVGEEAGRSFIVMQYIEGETLAARIAGKPLELIEVLDHAVQTARALAEAHSVGLIHRDIKPQNIMLTTRGQAMVMDFGLAKVVRDRSLTESEAVTETLLTERGEVVGTVPYMSPEQVQGEVLDARSDVFSFGAVLYEMVSGHKPFEADNSAALISAILSREPMRLTRYAVNVPTELERIARKCLEKNRERRYQTMRDVAIDLENLQREPALREESQTASLRVTGRDVKRSSVFTSRRALVFYSLAAVLGVAAIVYLVFLRGSPATKGPEIRSLAVIPLDNFSGDPTQDYLADGMTEALITELSKIGSLRVTSRASVMLYKAARKPLPEIGRELKVDVIVTGSVQRSGEKIGITAHLHRAATDQNLWVNQYERELRDVLSLQREIARAIAGEINVTLTPKEQGLLANARPVNPEAVNAYLNGLSWLHKAIDEPDTEDVERFHKRSFEYFEQAIKSDPNYALAYSALARSYHFLAGSGFPRFYPKAKESALKAIALDDNLAEAHGALAYTMWRYEWDFAGAEKEFKKAEDLAPNTYLWGYAQFLSTIGRHEEAIRRFRLAQELDPLIVYLKISAGQAYIEARQFDHAIAQFRSVIELDPKQFAAKTGLGTAYVLKGMFEEGIIELQKALDLSGDMDRKADLAWAYAMAGKRSESIKILNELKNPSKQTSTSHLALATIYSALGDKDLGMEQLERAHDKRGDGVLWLKVYPGIDGLRSDPRFQDLLRRIGFPQ